MGFGRIRELRIAKAADLKVIHLLTGHMKHHCERYHTSVADKVVFHDCLTFRYSHSSSKSIAPLSCTLLTSLLFDSHIVLCRKEGARVLDTSTLAMIVIEDSGQHGHQDNLGTG